MEWTASRSTAAGQDVRLGSWVAMTIDCTASPVEVRIVKRPMHGALAIMQADESAGFPREHPFAPCNHKVVRKKVVSYRSHAGFAGTDQAIVEASFPDDHVERTTYEISVRSATR